MGGQVAERFGDGWQRPSGIGRKRLTGYRLVSEWNYNKDVDVEVSEIERGVLAVLEMDDMEKVR
jgi:hypothetical protein